VAVSGCPASCAAHQVADLGLVGNRVVIGSEQVLGYRVHLGGDLRRDRLGEVLGRVAEADVETVAEIVVGTWERARRGGETLADTVARTGPAPFVAALHAHEGLAWEPGDESGEPRPALSS
jgi:sulfite reductase beta subunit-like hemoprotein